MENEQVVRSIRAESEVFEQFKRISESFPNQGAALQGLITAYEIQSAKNDIPDRATEIAEIDSDLHAISQAYLNSLVLNENAEQRVRTEFAAQLESKDKLIIDLQARLDSAKSAAAEAKTETEEAQRSLSDVTAQYSSEKVSYEEVVSSLRSDLHRSEQSIIDKDTIIGQLKAEIDRLSKDALEFDEQKARVQVAEKAQIAAEQAQQKAENILEQMIAKHKSETEIANQRAKNELEAAVIAERSKNIDVVQKLNDRIMAQSEEISALKTEIMQLKLRAGNNGNGTYTTGEAN